MDQERFFHMFSLSLAAAIARYPESIPAHERDQVIKAVAQWSLEGLAHWEKVVGEREVDDDAEV